MDEDNLKKILQDQSVPPINPEARKAAVNLAMAAFAEEQKKNQKNTQGMSVLSRLMSSLNRKNRRDPMNTPLNKRAIYGGMATAMAVVLATSVTGYLVTQQTRSGAGSTITAAQLNKVALKVDGERKENADFSMVARNIAPSPTPEAEVTSAPALEMADAAMDATPPSPIAASKRAMMPQESYSMAGAPMALQRGQASSAFAPPMGDQIYPSYYQDTGRDKFEDFKENTPTLVGEEPVSTFSIDVDTASYSFVRRQLNNGVMPQKNAVRIEEMINYFDYNYPAPTDATQPFKTTISLTDSPWAAGKKLMHIGIKGYDVPNITVDDCANCESDAAGSGRRSNLVFLLDTSGSMNAPDKLPLLKNSLKMLLETLNPDDTIAIATYAGSSGVALEPTPVKDKQKIFAAMDNLQAGGGTAGAAGINLAYQLAEQNFDKDAVNRVILATDGDFNIGITNQDELKDYIERQREKGVYLSVLGFGQGNYNDQLMQTLAQNGNGTAAYIDTLNEARKVLVEEASSTLFPIAKDVKIQVEFNPAMVASYRLVGYETRHLNREDFNNDKVDAGDIGSGHTVTAIYEITPVGSNAAPDVDPLRYGSADASAAAQKPAPVNENANQEYAFLKVRYKLPQEDTSHLITTPVTADQASLSPEMQREANWATAVAGFAQLLKGSAYVGSLTYEDVIALANNNKGDDPYGYRAEFIQMVRLAQSARNMQPQ